MSEAAPSPIASGTAGPARPLAGIALMLAVAVVVPAMDGIAKALGERYPVAEVVWARYIFHLFLLLPVVLWRYGRRVFRPRRPGLQALRGVFQICTTALFFAAITVMPLTDALALALVSPLVVTALSPWVLGEKVGVRRWSAVIVGFAGACIVIRPGFGVFHWGSLLALGAGVGFALYFLTTRKLSGSDPPLLTLTYAALLGAIVMSAILPAVWVTPTLPDLALMMCLGVIAASGQFLLIRALDMAPASMLAPYGYAEIVMLTLIGYVFFGDFPDAVTWTGLAVIVASGIYISLRERHLKEA